MQVSGGSQSFNVVNQLRVLGRWTDGDDSEPVLDRQGIPRVTDEGR